MNPFNIYKNILLISLFGILVSCEQKQPIKSIAPPLKSVIVHPEKRSIDPTKAQEVVFDNGTRVSVPANAFTDQNGNVLTTPVDLELQTFNNVASVIASGIPMTYSEDGEELYFESAGMFDIKGYSDGNEVNIAKDKSLNVHMASDVYGDFDFYYFDEIELSQSAVDPVDNVARQGSWQKLSYLTEESSNSFDSTKIKAHFQLKFMKDQYEELAPLEEIIWDQATDFNNPKQEQFQWVMEEEWTSVVVDKPKYAEKETYVLEKNGKQKSWPMPTFLESINRFIVSEENGIIIYDLKGNVIQTIDQVSSSPDFMGNRYFLCYHSSERDGVIVYDAVDGKALHFFEDAYGFEFSEKENILIYEKRTNRKNQNRVIYMAQMNGKLIKKFELKDKEYKSDCYQLSEAGSLLINDKNVLTMYDSKGNQINRISGEYKNIKIFKDKYVCALDVEKDKLVKWNFKTDQLLESPDLSFNVTNEDVGIAKYDPYFSELLADESAFLINISSTVKTSLYRSKFEHSDFSLVWDLDKNIIEKHPFRFMHENKILTEEGYYGVNEANELYSFNEKTKKSIKMTGLTWNKGAISTIRQRSDFNIVNKFPNAALFNSKGVLIRDFSQLDSLGVIAGFKGDSLTYSLQHSGIYKVWSQNGKIISEKQLEDFQGIQEAFVNKQSFWTAIREQPNLRKYNEEGELMLVPETYSKLEWLDNYKIPRWNRNREEYVKYDLVELDPDVYQMTLSNKNKIFRSYVYLNEETRRKLEKYNTFRLRKRLEEKNRRQAECSLLRSFEVKQFGIYNWDRIQKMDGRISFTAEFDFGESTELNQITTFLITDLNGVSVVKYYEGTWDKFSVDPKSKNMIVAVLPRNRIAVFSKEDFEKIDWDKVKQEKRFKFKMTIQPGEVAKLDDLEAVL